MVEPSSPHKSSKTSQENGEYSTDHLQMHSLMAKQNILYRLSRTVSQGHGRGRGPTPSNPLIHHTPLNHSLPSPAELLNSRKFRCLLPIRVKQHNHTQQYRNPTRLHTTIEMPEIYPVSRLEEQSIYNSHQIQGNGYQGSSLKE